MLTNKLDMIYITLQRYTIHKLHYTNVHRSATLLNTNYLKLR
jgi:hypothetical protein